MSLWPHIVLHNVLSHQCICFPDWIIRNLLILFFFHSVLELEEKNKVKYKNQHLARNIWKKYSAASGKNEWFNEKSYTFLKSEFSKGKIFTHFPSFCCCYPKIYSFYNLLSEFSSMKHTTWENIIYSQFSFILNKCIFALNSCLVFQIKPGRNDKCQRE